MRVRPVVLLQNPYDRYAVRFIELYAAQGIGTVAWFTDRTQMRRQSWQFPELFSDAVDARYFVGPGELEAFAAHVRSAHDVVGVVPFLEPYVADADRLAALLGLDWAQGETRRRFRDKHGLKELLRSVPDGPRINASGLVRSVADVEDLLATGSFDRFVLKPNDGLGSQGLGFFDSSDLDAVRAFLAERAGSPALLEEFIGGDEYFVNGQVDAAGCIDVLLVGRYDKRPFNDRPNVKFGHRVVRTHEPEFRSLVDYATTIIRASGLRRSPFHLEAKIDDRGPCLIEVAARLCGTGEPFLDSRAHGTVDAFALAAHSFVSTEPIDVALDWNHYDGACRGQAVGVSEVSGRMYEVDGLGEVEAMPEFLWWWEHPAIGQRFDRTGDILAPPYVVYLEAPDPGALAEAMARVQRTVTWNASSSGARRAVRSALSRGPVVSRRAREWVLRPRLTEWRS